MNLIISIDLVHFQGNFIVKKLQVLIVLRIKCITFEIGCMPLMMVSSHQVGRNKNIKKHNNILQRSTKYKQLNICSKK